MEIVVVSVKLHHQVHGCHPKAHKTRKNKNIKPIVQSVEGFFFFVELLLEDILLLFLIHSGVL